MRLVPLSQTVLRKSLCARGGKHYLPLLPWHSNPRKNKNGSRANWPLKHRYNCIFFSPQMTTSPASNPPTQRSGDEAGSSSVSHFQKTVTLRDWWLIKSDKDFEGKRLAIAGFDSTGNRAFRIFNSAPIVKRYDVFTLETADGILVVIQGFINKTRTIENGFSYQIFDHFLFGFPPCWEEFAENCLAKDVDPASDARHTSGFDKSTTDPAAATREDSIPTSISIEDKEADQDVSVDPVNATNLCDHTSNTSVQQNSEIALSHSLEVSIEDVVPQNENCPSFPVSSLPATVLGVATRDAWNDLHFPPLSHCHVRDVNLTEDSIVLQAGPSSHLGEEASPQSGHCERSKKCDQKSIGNSKTTQSDCIHYVPTNGDLSKGTLLSKDSATDNLNAPALDQTASVGISTMMPTVSSSGMSLRNTREENERNSDRSKSDTSSLQGLLMRHEDSVLGSPAIDSNIPEQTANYDKDAMILTAKTDATSSSNVKMNILASSNSGRTKRNPSQNLKDDPILKAHPRSPPGSNSNIMEQTANHLKDNVTFAGLQSGVEGEVASPVEKNPGNGAPIKLVYGKMSPCLRNLKDSKHESAVSGSCIKHKNNKLMSEVIEHLDENELKRGSNTTLSSPTKVDLVDAMLRTGRRLRNASGDSKSQDKNGQADVKEGGSSKKRARRKIYFDAHVTPHTCQRKEKTCILSPESLSVKRSRSGRLLLPTLDFWRNQIPVYDAERNITGIQEELNAGKSSRGKTEPKMKQKR